MKIDIHKSDTDGDIITLLEDYTVTWNGKTLTIPAGFKSDGVSTPMFLWATISPSVDPRTIRAGVSHDYIYRIQPEGWTRAKADKMFYDFIREDGLRFIPSVKAYLGLRLFGGVAWKENRKRLETEADAYWKDNAK